MSEEEKRKLQAKRFNEHIKLLVTTINASGLVIFAAGVLQPIVATGAGVTLGQPVSWLWIALGAITHVVAQGLIRLIRLE